MKHPTWFSRFKTHPISCSLHILQGAVASALACLAGEYGLYIASVWFLGFVAYQALSFARKKQDLGRGDTAGLDCFDFVVGVLVFAPFGVYFG